MPKIIDVIESSLFNKKIIVEEKKIFTLKIFYKFDVDIKEQVITQPPEQVPVEPPPDSNVEQSSNIQPGVPPVTMASMPAESVFSNKYGSLFEAEGTSNSMIIRKNGEVPVSINEAKDVMELNDIFQILKRKLKKNGQSIFNDIMVQICTITLSENNSQSLADVIAKDDKVRIEVDYGKHIDDSIGFLISKPRSIDEYNVSLKESGKIIGKFDIKSFNKYLVEVYRNSAV